MVSILVLLDWRWRPWTSRRVLSFQRVSILVLLDWRWRPARRTPEPDAPPGFNPCSVGLEMAAQEGRFRPLCISGFQSLFCWIGDGGPHPAPRTGRNDRVSILVLLDWRWRPRPLLPKAERMQGFNPCSVGLEMAAVSKGAKMLIAFLFQSLFCWIGDGGRDREQEPTNQEPFQSLFCWIGDGGLPYRGGPGRTVRVSILVLLDWRWRRGR